MKPVLVFAFQYFWFLAALMGVMNFLSAYGRARRVAGAEPDLAGGEWGALLPYLLFMTVPALLLGALQLAGRYPSPFFIFHEPRANPYKLASLAVWALAGAAWGCWVVFGGGARRLAAYHVLGPSDHPMGVERLIRAMTLLGVAGLAILLTLLLIAGPAR